VVPFAAGGPTDTLARILSERMNARLGQPLVIENVAGAAGSLGTGRVARSTPDGYTLVIGFLGTHVLNGAIYSLGYDVQKDFEPIALLASNPLVIIAKKATPAKDLKELIAWLRANPGKAVQATPGAGTPRMSPAPTSSGARNRISVCALSWCGAGYAGFGGRPYRHDVRSSFECITARA
jgi:tripartite-type tricarboxylate transporter receptor subunit TctC